MNEKNIKFAVKMYRKPTDKNKNTKNFHKKNLQRIFMFEFLCFLLCAGTGKFMTTD